MGREGSYHEAYLGLAWRGQGAGAGILRSGGPELRPFGTAQPESGGGAAGPFRRGSGRVALVSHPPSYAANSVVNWGRQGKDERVPPEFLAQQSDPFPLASTESEAAFVIGHYPEIASFAADSFGPVNCHYSY